MIQRTLRAVLFLLIASCDVIPSSTSSSDATTDSGRSDRTSDSSSTDSQRVLLVRAIPDTNGELKFLKSLQHNKRNLKLQIWRTADQVDRHVDIWVENDSWTQFREILLRKKIPHEVIINDIHSIKGFSDISMKNIEEFDDHYQRYEEIIGEMKRLAQVFPEQATLLTIGLSYEKRPLQVVHIHANKSLTEKRKVFINCGSHSREWLGIAACKYLVRYILFNHAYDSDIKSMLQDFDIYVQPIMNPDGYKFSHDRGYRLWRKSRSPTNNYGCTGVDLNRNFNFRWGSQGSSPDPCDETYSGEHPFSESESLGTARFLYKIRRTVRAFIDVHTFGQMWMSPWGYTTAYPQHHAQQARVLRKIRKALLRHEHIGYSTGLAGRMLYETSGDSLDWAYGQLGIVHSYAVELRPHSSVKSIQGFKIDRRMIKPTGRDLLTGLKALTLAIADDEFNSLRH